MTAKSRINQNARRRKRNGPVSQSANPQPPSAFPERRVVVDPDGIVPPPPVLAHARHLGNRGSTPIRRVRVGHRDNERHSNTADKRRGCFCCAGAIGLPLLLLRFWRRRRARRCCRLLLLLRLERRPGPATERVTEPREARPRSRRDSGYRLSG